jgi:putative addiction module component (TIGR02574 family)
MPTTIDELLSLPSNERRKIAEQLWSSLSPSSTISKEDKDVISLLEKRWENLKSGESKTYSSEEIKSMITEHRKAK